MAEPIPLPTPAQTVTLTALLIPLMRLCLLVVSMGIVACVDALCRAFFGTLEGSIGWIPFLGRVAQQPIHAIEHKVSNYLGGLESHIDASMGGYFHALADALGRLSSGEAETGWALYLYGKAIGALRHDVNTLPSIGSVHTITRTVIKQRRVVVTKVERIGKIAAHSAPASLVGSVKAIAGTLEDVITWDIPGLRARTKAIERRLDELAKRVRADAKPLAGAAFAGAVAFALSRLGVSWIRCGNWKKIGRGVCRTPSGEIDALLGLFAAGATIASFRQLVELGQEVEHGVAATLQEVAKL